MCVVCVCVNETKICLATNIAAQETFLMTPLIPKHSTEPYVTLSSPLSQFGSAIVEITPMENENVSFDVWVFFLM